MIPNRIDGVEIPKGYATNPSFALERGLVRAYKARQAEVDELVKVLDEGLGALMRLMLRLDTSEVDGTIRKMQQLIAKYKGETE